jgi:hypothetical protein
MKKFLTLAAGMLLLSSAQAFAATAGALFSGAVTSTCVLTAGTPGIIAPNSDYTGLSSQNAGGLSSSVAALATGSSFKVSAIAPNTFLTAPADGNTNTSFASSYSLSGSTTASNVAGATQTPLNSGSATVSVNLAASKSSGNFSAGAYTAEVTVRCE